MNVDKIVHALGQGVTLLKGLSHEFCAVRALPCKITLSAEGTILERPTCYNAINQ